MAPDPQGTSNQEKFPRKPNDDEKKLLAGALFPVPNINFDDVWLLSELKPGEKLAKSDPISFALLCPELRPRTGTLEEVSGICGEGSVCDVPFLYTQKPPEKDTDGSDGNTSGSDQDDSGDTKPLFDQETKFQQDVVVSRCKDSETRVLLSRHCTPGLLELYGKRLNLDLDGSKLDKLVVGPKKPPEPGTSGKDQEGSGKDQEGSGKDQEIPDSNPGTPDSKPKTPVSKPGDFLWMTKLGRGQGVIAHPKEWLDTSKWGGIKARFRFSSMEKGPFYDGLAVHSLFSREDWGDWMDLMDHKLYDDQQGKKNQRKYEMSVLFKSRKDVAVDILDLSGRNLGHDCYFEGEFKTLTLDRIKSCGSVTVRHATIETLSLKNAFINKRLMFSEVVIDDFNAKGMKCGLVTKEMLDHYKEKHPRSVSSYMDDYGFLLWLNQVQDGKSEVFGFICNHLTLKGQFNLNEAEIGGCFELKNCTNEGKDENLDFSGSELVEQSITLEEKDGEKWKTTAWSKEVIEIAIKSEDVTIGEKDLPKLEYTLKIEKSDPKKAYRIKISEPKVREINGQWEDIIWTENGKDRDILTRRERDKKNDDKGKNQFLWPYSDKQKEKNLYHQPKEYFGKFDKKEDGKKQAAKTADKYVSTAPQEKKDKSKDHN